MLATRRVLAVITAAVAAFIVAGCSGGTSAPPKVQTTVVKTASIEKTLEISGILAPNQTATVFSRLSGIAHTITSDVGRTVKAGQLLVQVDTSELDAQLKVAQAAVQAVKDQAAQAKLGIQTASTNLALAKKSYDRVSALFKSQAVAQSRLDDAQNKLQLATNAYKNANQQYKLLTSSSLEQAQAHENLIQVQIANGRITAPITGIITNRNINPGEVVNPGVPLFTIADTSILRLQGNVSQDAVPLTKIGQTAKIRVDGFPGHVFTGTVSQIGPVAASTGQYFPVVITLKDEDGLMAGMTAVASLQFTGPQGLVVPLSAVHTTNGKNYVYVVMPGNAGNDNAKATGTAKVKSVEVSLGLHNATETELEGEVKAGNTVVSSDVDLLQNGSVIETQQ